MSRRGSVAAMAREVEQVLAERGYTVIVQDYDFPLSANFVEAMHEAIQNSRDLVILFTRDYEASPYTRKEFTSFEADRAQSVEERRVVILRCEDAPLRGLLAPNVYQDLVGVLDPAERKRRIIAAAEGQSLASRPPPRSFAGAPPRIASFTGREAELDRLDAILLGGDRPAAVTQVILGRAAVQGMGGVGKTSLAVEYAYRYRDLYGGVWWCPAEARVDLLSALAALAAHLGVAATDDHEQAAKAGLRRLAEQRAIWLLVYDNVTGPEEIADLLPAAGARVLITSRFPDWAGWAQEVSLDVLPPAEAATFVQSRAGREDPPGAATLAEALGYLPLALDHAAAYCRRTQTRFADYAAKVAEMIVAAPRGTSYPRSVAATFALALDAAVMQRPSAEALMAYLAQCGPERIPMTLVEGAIDNEVERAAALLALTEVSLVKNDPFEDDTPAVSVHRLVKASARTRAAASNLAMTAAARVSTRLLQIAKDKTPGVRGSLARMLYRIWEQQHEEGWQLLEQIGCQVVRGGFSLLDSVALEAFTEVSLLFFNGCRDNPEQMARLGAVWRAELQLMFAAPLTRFVYRDWILKLLSKPMVSALASQPSSQPLNFRELENSFSNSQALRGRWLQALSCLEKPENSLFPVVDILSQKDMSYDIYLQLICEKVLIYHGAKVDLAGTFLLLEKLFESGCAWFGSSILQVIYQVLTIAPRVEDGWLDRYVAVSEKWFASKAWKLKTKAGEYNLAAFIALPEMVNNQHRPRSEPRLLPRLIERAIADNDPEQIDGLLNGIDAVAAASNRGQLALTLIHQAFRVGGGGLRDRLRRSLATVRPRDQAMVDQYLDRRDDLISLRAGLEGVEPSHGEVALPELLDGLTVHYLVNSDYFRGRLCNALGRAAHVHDSREFFVRLLGTFRDEFSPRAQARRSRGA